MSNLDRQNNFRTNYVGRMVGDKAECSRFQIEEQILSEDADVDLAKLAQFAFKHHIPGVHRVPIWKLLLRVSSTAPEVRKRIAGHRTQEAEVLLSSLSAMRMTSVRSDDGSKLNMEYQPTAIDIVRMIELGDGYSSMLSDQHTLDYNGQARLSIARQMSFVCESNWVDTYWLTKVFDELLSRIFTREILSEVVDSLKSQFIKAHKGVGQNFEDQIWTRIPMSLWIRCGGAVIFAHEPLLRLWDKLCSSADEGIIKLLSAVIYRYLAELTPLLSNLEVSNFTFDENNLSIKTQNAIIEKSIDSMFRSGKFGCRKYET